MNSPQKQFQRALKSKSLSFLITPGIGTALIVFLTLFGIMPVQSDTPLALKESEKTMVGHSISNFTLTNLEGRQVALSDFKDKGVIVLFLMGKGCPVANLYLTELKKLQDAYEKKG